MLDEIVFMRFIWASSPVAVTLMDEKKSAIIYSLRLRTRHTPAYRFFSEALRSKHYREPGSLSSSPSPTRDQPYFHRSIPRRSDRRKHLLEPLPDPLIRNVHHCSFPVSHSL